MAGVARWFVLLNAPVSNGQYGQNCFLPIQRQMVSELGHHHGSQQGLSWDAFIDHLHLHLHLDERFALAANPFPTLMLLDCEHA